MNINKAFEILGLDLNAFLEAMSSKSLKSKIDTIDSYLNLASSHKKQLMVANHPDRGGDPDKFKMINEAFNFIQDQSNKAKETLNYKMEITNKSRVKLEIN